MHYILLRFIILLIYIIVFVESVNKNSMTVFKSVLLIITNNIATGFIIVKY